MRPLPASERPTRTLDLLAVLHGLTADLIRVVPAVVGTVANPFGQNASGAVGAVMKQLRHTVGVDHRSCESRGLGTVKAAEKGNTV